MTVADLLRQTPPYWLAAFVAEIGHAGAVDRRWVRHAQPVIRRLDPMVTVCNCCVEVEGEAAFYTLVSMDRYRCSEYHGRHFIAWIGECPECQTMQWASTLEEE